MILSAATIAAQQKLSEKYGIPTFDLSGKISTIPLTRPITNINVGVGSTGLTSEALTDFLKKITPQSALIPVRPVQLPDKTIIDIPIDAKLTAGEIPIGLQTIPTSTTSELTKYIPYLIIAGVIFAGISLVRN